MKQTQCPKCSKFRLKDVSPRGKMNTIALGLFFLGCLCVVPFGILVIPLLFAPALLLGGVIAHIIARNLVDNGERVCLDCGYKCVEF